MSIFESIANRDRGSRHQVLFACLLVSAVCLLLPGTGLAGDALDATYQSASPFALNLDGDAHSAAADSGVSSSSLEAASAWFGLVNRSQGPSAHISEQKPPQSLGELDRPPDLQRRDNRSRAIQAISEGFQVWLLDNIDPDYTNHPFDDELIVMDNLGATRSRTAGLNICQTIGAWRAVDAADDGEFAIVCEFCSAIGRITRIDRSGTIAWSRYLSATAVDVSEDGHAYVAVGHSIGGSSVFKLDADTGATTAGAFLGGIDIAVDDEHDAVWLVGADIKKLNKNLELEFQLDPIPWAAPSVDYDSDGYAWVAVRGYPPRPDQLNRLLRVSDEGDVEYDLTLPYSPSCVAVDRRDDSVWVTMFHPVGSLQKYSSAGDLVLTIDDVGSPWSARVDQASGNVWVAERDATVRAFSSMGDELLVVPGAPGDPYRDAWLALGPTVGPVEASLDIRPGSCPNPINVRSRGVLPVVLLGDTGFDVLDIDPASVTLEGVPPLRDTVVDLATPSDDEACRCQAASPDGVPDLSLKFETQEIVAALGQVQDREERPLTLMGTLFDGTPFEATDCVRILAGGPLVEGFSGDSDAGGFQTQAGLPEGVSLHEPRPNPITRTGQITYTLPNAMMVRLSVYDAAGRLIDRLVEGVESPGEHVVQWDAGRVSSGTYFYRLEAGDEVRTERAILIR